MADAQPDYEQFERRQLTQDQDNTQDRDNQRVQAVDADKSKARLIMQDFRGAGCQVSARGPMGLTPAFQRKI